MAECLWELFRTACRLQANGTSDGLKDGDQTNAARDLRVRRTSIHDPWRMMR